MSRDPESGIYESEIEDELEFEYDDDDSFPEIYSDEEEDEDEDDGNDNDISKPSSIINEATNKSSTTMTSSNSTTSSKNILKGNRNASASVHGLSRYQHVTAQYKPWSIEEYIAVHFISKCQRLQQMKLPHCDFDDLLIMLHSKHWQEDNVINSYYDDPAKLFESCGLPQLDKQRKNNKFAVVKNFLCPICCCDDDVQSETYSLTCNHRYCTRCYSRYVVDAVHMGQLITCPQCKLSIPHKDVQRFIDQREGEKAKLEREQKNHLDVANDNGDDDNEEDDDEDEEDDDDDDDDDDDLIDNKNGSKMGLTSKYLSSDFSFTYTKADLLRYAARLQIELSISRKFFRWCPAPDCKHLVELTSEIPSLEANDQLQPLNLNKVPIVHCPDAHEFCFECLYENHLPCPCWVVKMWIKKCNDDSETANWIQANTQSCPKCDTSIEKSGGCNHMTCKKCHFEFCWICMQTWDSHGQQFYNCNRYDPQQINAVKKLQYLKRLSLKRYLFFFKRFSIHETSMQGDRKTLRKVNRRMKKYMEEELRRRNSEGGNNNNNNNNNNKNNNNKGYLSWIDVQFLNDAVRQLTIGRKTLKWTYVFAFYLSQSNFAEIFEQMEDYLNKTVEDLSHIFEVIIDRKNEENSSKLILKHKQEIINLSNLVAQRQEKLIECAFSGLNLNLLKLEKSDE